jgi:hypothetical protein
MDLEELRFREAATRQGLSLWNNDDGTWSVGAPASLEPLRPGQPVKPSEYLISDDRIRLADGRVFKRRMTTEELREALGLDTNAEPD